MTSPDSAADTTGTPTPNAASPDVTLRPDCTIGNEQFALVVESHHTAPNGPVVARTAVHRQAFRRRVGGARFVRRGSLAEVGNLSAAMTWKCAAAYLPADGEKSVLSCEGADLPDHADRVRILGEHLRAVIAADPGVTFGPDMNNPESVMDALAAQDELRDHVTGLSGAQGGFSIDDRGYTAHGLVAAVDTLIAHKGTELETASIQGFGAVGAHAARLLHERGIAIVAVSTVHGALIAESSDDDAKPAGLDIPMLFAAWHERGDDAFAEFAKSPPPNTTAAPDPDALLAVPVHLFVPAARTAVLGMPDELERVRASENPACRDVTAFHRVTGVRAIAEGANHPVTSAGTAYLESQGVVSLTDFIANCGGLVGCFVEWAHRDECRASAERRESLHEKTLAVITRIVGRNVRALLDAPDSGTAAAHVIAETNRAELLEKLAAFNATGTPDPHGHVFARQTLAELLDENAQ